MKNKTIIIPNPRKSLLKRFESKFNMDHFLKVLTARDKLGKIFVRDHEMKNHDLIGKKCHCLDNDKDYTVDKVWKNWYRGYYIVLALVNENKSHRIFFWDNISCHEPIIAEEIEYNKLRIKFL